MSISVFYPFFLTKLFSLFFFFVFVFGFVADNALVFHKDERFVAVNGKSEEKAECLSTIAAIVTSVGGPPSAVGIVRLSGPTAVDIVGRVFRPAKRKGKSSGSWWPTSHVVEYGTVLDHQGNVIDEV